MKSDEVRQMPPQRPGSPDEEFAKLRGRFHRRLRKEHTQLTALIQALGGTKERPALIVPSIQAFAHRLRGAALVFEYPELAAKAKTVELSAIASLLRDGNPLYETAVVSAMNQLGSRLSHEISGGGQHRPIVDGGALW
jgi:hypothetical protein